MALPPTVSAKDSLVQLPAPTQKPVTVAVPARTPVSASAAKALAHPVLVLPAQLLPPHQQGGQAAAKAPVQTPPTSLGREVLPRAHRATSLLHQVARRASTKDGLMVKPLHLRRVRLHLHHLFRRQRSCWPRFRPRAWLSIHSLGCSRRMCPSERGSSLRLGLSALLTRRLNC